MATCIYNNFLSAICTISVYKYATDFTIETTKGINEFTDVLFFVLCNAGNPKLTHYSTL